MLDHLDEHLMCLIKLFSFILQRCRLFLLKSLESAIDIGTQEVFLNFMQNVLLLLNIFVNSQEARHSVGELVLID